MDKNNKGLPKQSFINAAIAFFSHKDRYASIKQKENNQAPAKRGYHGKHKGYCKGAFGGKPAFMRNNPQPAPKPVKKTTKRKAAAKKK